MNTKQRRTKKLLFYIICAIMLPVTTFSISITLFCVLPSKNNKEFIPSNIIAAPVETKVSIRVYSNTKMKNEDFFYDYDNSWNLDINYNDQTKCFDLVSHSSNELDDYNKQNINILNLKTSKYFRIHFIAYENYSIMMNSQYSVLLKSNKLISASCENYESNFNSLPMPFNTALEYFGCHPSDLDFQINTVDFIMPNIASNSDWYPSYRDNWVSLNNVKSYLKVDPLSVALYKETTNDQYFKLNYSPFSSFNSSLITSNNISNFIPNGYSSNINSTYARFNDDQSFLIYTWDQGAEEAVELTTTDTPKLLFDTANIFNLAQGTLTLHDNQIFDWSIHQSESDSIKLSFSVLLAETTAQGQIQSYVSQRSDARHPYFVKDPYTSSTYYEKSFYSTGCNITNVNLLDLSFNDNPSNPITIDFSSGYTLGEAIEYRMTPPDGNGHYTICARLKDDIHLTIKKGNDVLKNVVFSSGDNNVYVKTY